MSVEVFTNEEIGEMETGDEQDTFCCRVASPISRNNIVTA